MALCSKIIIAGNLTLLLQCSTNSEDGALWLCLLPHHLFWWLQLQHLPKLWAEAFSRSLPDVVTEIKGVGGEVSMGRMLKSIVRLTNLIQRCFFLNLFKEVVNN